MPSFIRQHAPQHRQWNSFLFMAPFAFLLDRIYRIYKIVFKQVEQEMQESLGPPSAGFGGNPSLPPVSPVLHAKTPSSVSPVLHAKILSILLILSKNIPLRTIRQKFSGAEELRTTTKNHIENRRDLGKLLPNCCLD